MRHLLFLFVGMSLVLTQSCQKMSLKKAETVVKQTISATIKANETYTFTMPANTSDDPFEITTQAGHFTLSALGKNAAGELIYQYTPELDYVGTDAVVIANVEEQHPGGCMAHDSLGMPPHDSLQGNHPHHPHGLFHPRPKHDKHDDEVEQEITINITIEAGNVDKTEAISTATTSTK